MAGRLEGKRVLITAAAQGMGRSAAVAMAKEGALVMATDVRGDLLESLSEESTKQGGRSIQPRLLDVTQKAGINKLVAEMEPLNVSTMS